MDATTQPRTWVRVSVIEEGSQEVARSLIALANERARVAGVCEYVLYASGGVSRDNWVLRACRRDLQLLPS